MDNHKPYVLCDREIFPYSGEFDFNSKEQIKEKHLNLHYLALDIAESIHGPGSVEAKSEQDIIYRKLNDNSYSLCPRIKSTLGIDLYKFVKKGENQQKTDALRLIKVLYHFIKNDEDGKKVMSLLENPSLDNIQSDYCERPFYTEIHDMKEVLDYLNKKRQGDCFQEVYPVGYEEFTVNEAVFRNEIILKLSDGNADFLKELNCKLEKIEKNYLEACKFSFNDKLQETEDLDVLELFSSALDRYYLKCMNKTFINILEEFGDFLEKTEYFNDDSDLWKLFINQEFQFISEKEIKQVSIKQLLKDLDAVKLITQKEEPNDEEDRSILKALEEEAEYVIQNYFNLYWERKWDDELKTFEDSAKKNIWICILQMLYVCRKENVQYTTDSLGDKIPKRSLKEVFRKWNKKENLDDLKRLNDDQIWHLRKPGFMIDVPAEFVDESSHFENRGQNERRRNIGKEYLIGKLFPQLIYARNILSKDKFTEYITFLKKYHEIQIKLCENIVYDEFVENSALFFEWLMEEIEADVWYGIPEKEKPVDAWEEIENMLYASFRKDFLLNTSDTYQRLFGLEWPEDISWAKEKFISEDIVIVYEVLKELLPPRCRTEYNVLQKLFLTNNEAVFDILNKKCFDYKYDAFVFLRKIFEKISEDEYKVWKEFLRNNKNIEYDLLKMVLAEECIKETEIEKAFLQCTKKEQRIMKECWHKINEFEFCILDRLIQRK